MNLLAFQLSRKFAAKKVVELFSTAPAGVAANGPRIDRNLTPAVFNFPPRYTVPAITVAQQLARANEAGSNLPTVPVLADKAQSVVSTTADSVAIAAVGNTSSLSQSGSSGVEAGEQSRSQGDNPPPVCEPENAKQTVRDGSGSNFASGGVESRPRDLVTYSDGCHLEASTKSYGAPVRRESFDAKSDGDSQRETVLAGSRSSDRPACNSISTAASSGEKGTHPRSGGANRDPKTIHCVTAGETAFTLPHDRSTPRMLTAQGPLKNREVKTAALLRADQTENARQSSLLLGITPLGWMFVASAAFWCYVTILAANHFCK